MKLTILKGDLDIRVTTCELAMVVVVVPVPIIVVLVAILVVVMIDLKGKSRWIALNWCAIGECPLDDERDAVVTLGVEGPIDMAVAPS